MMKKKIGLVALLVILFTLLFAVNAQAACSHSSYKFVTKKAATCCAAGYKSRVCSSCGKVLTLKASTIPATGKHTSVKTCIAISPKCTTAGRLRVFCAASGKLIQTKRLNPLGHNIVFEISWKAGHMGTAPSGQYYKEYCNVCNTVFKEEYTGSADLGSFTLPTVSYPYGSPN